MFSVGSLLRPHASVLPVLIRLRRVALISFSCLDPRSYLNIQNSCIHNIVAPQGAREAYKCLNILHEERDKIWTVDLFHVYEFLWRCLFTVRSDRSLNMLFTNCISMLVSDMGGFLVRHGGGDLFLSLRYPLEICYISYSILVHITSI